MNVLARAMIPTLALLLALACAPQTAAASAASMVMKETKALESQPKGQSDMEQKIQNASPDELNRILAAMSDDQVRKLLISTLHKQEQAKAAAQEKFSVLGALKVFQQTVTRVRDRIEFVLSGAARAPSLLPQAVQKALQGKDARSLPQLLLGLAVLVVTWLGGRWLLAWKAVRLRNRLSTPSGAGGLLDKLLRILARAFVEGLFLILVAIFVIVIYFLAFDDTSSTRPLLFLFLFVFLLYETVLLGVRILLAPDAPGLRFLPFSDVAARSIFKLGHVVGLEIAAGILLGGLLQLTDSSEALYLLVLSLTGLLVVATITLISIWKQKEVAAHLKSTFPPGTLRYQLAGVWHILLIGYVCFFWLFWGAHILAFGNFSILQGVLTLLAFPLYLLLTWIMDKIVVYTGSVARSALLEQNVDPADPATDYMVDEHGQPYSPKCPVARFRRFLSRALSVVLFGVFAISLAAIWNIQLPLADRVVEGAFSILMTLILAYMFWAFSKAAIERKLQAQGLADDGEGGEVGGGGGDRLSTLLELLKRFILVSLVVVVSLIVLSSLGIDTKPLLAGAGVLGIALGFGSQTLVKDIVSGVFFLMDDAFRIGDYVVLGEAMGTVEAISVRSLKLRHHRGRLFTVPYGSIKMVDNFSRDWAIMKLEYVVPFDTDIQQVKKIVKRINKEIKEVPELAEVMLGDIKSQGVKNMEEYGMRMRIKMTTIPGGQFTLRKWVWGKLRRYFDEAGIQFASKRVSVMLPEDKKADKEELLAAAAAAAEAAEEQQEDAKLSKQKGPS